jgi:predicted nucleotidyltransferase
MDLPPDVDRLLTALRGRLVARGGLVGLYLYGSLTTGDFSPARSDIDVIAMLAQDPDEAAVRDLGRLHAALQLTTRLVGCTACTCPRTAGAIRRHCGGPARRSGCRRCSESRAATSPGG